MSEYQNFDIGILKNSETLDTRRDGALKEYQNSILVRISEFWHQNSDIFQGAITRGI